MALGCSSTAESSLLLTDQDEMLELMQHNIRLNGVESRATALVLKWQVGSAAPFVSSTDVSWPAQGRAAAGAGVAAAARRDPGSRVRLL